MAKSPAAPLDATLLGVPKGAAAPPADVTPRQETAPAEATPPGRRPSPIVAPPPVEEPRTALTVRLPVSTQERLREAAHRTRIEKQEIVNEAILAWLDERGF